MTSADLPELQALLDLADVGEDLAFAQYRVDPGGGHAPWALRVLELRGARGAGSSSPSPRSGASVIGR